jgi:hypothetical protein
LGIEDYWKNLLDMIQQVEIDTMVRPEFSFAMVAGAAADDLNPHGTCSSRLK